MFFLVLFILPDSLSNQVNEEIEYEKILMFVEYIIFSQKSEQLMLFLPWFLNTFMDNFNFFVRSALFLVLYFTYKTYDVNTFIVQ